MTQITAQQFYSPNHKHTLFVDYDGSLIPLVKILEEGKLNLTTATLINQLLKKNNINLIIVSGRPIDFLRNEFKKSPVHLAGEHGGFFYNSQTEEITQLAPLTHGKEIYLKISQKFQDITHYLPKSFVETKKLSIALHYGNSDPVLASHYIDTIKFHIQKEFNFITSLFEGKNVFEIKFTEVDKGQFIQWFVNNFSEVLSTKMLAIGDDLNDEAMFKEVNRFGGTSFKIGKTGNTSAHYCFSSQKEFITFLENIAKL